MVTKTFRAKNMLLALQEVQSELGADAMILSMREVPSGSVWAAWRKPGVEVIASRSAKVAKSTDIIEKVEPAIEMASDVSSRPTSEELKREIENLKLVLNGQKIPFETHDQKKQEMHLGEILAASAKKTTKEQTHFDIDDFEKLPQVDNTEKIRILKKSEELLSKSEMVKVENSKVRNLPTNLQEVKQVLLGQSVNSELIEKIINTNIDSLSPAALDDLPRLNRFIMHQLSVCLTPTRQSMAYVPSRVMVLTGTSGSGKTATCAKLASFYMMTMGKKVVWIEADTVKTSAIAEARTYTETLGIPLFLAYSPQELNELINSQADADLILVDTSSCNPRDEDKVTELGSYLTNVPAGSTYLVASATTQEYDLIQAAKTFRQFGLKGLILTKTDETGSFGACFDLVWQSKLPIFFFTTGIQIFGNLKIGNPDQLVTAIFDGEFPRD